VPPSGGIPLQIVPAGLGNVLGSSLTLRALGRLSNPSEGPAFETLISKGLGAQVLWGGCRTPQGATFEPLISRRARGPFPSPRRILFEISPFPVLVARERERGKRYEFK
jgi:hypothetical protein